jgi:hypothetical protein
VTAKLLLACRTIGKTSKALAGPGGLKRLRRGGKSVSVKVAGGGKSLTRRVKILR